MKSTLTMALSFCLLLLTTFLVPGCDDTKGELQEVFDKYVSASRAGDGDTVVSLIDPKNVEHYDYLVQCAQSAPRQDIDRLEATERLMVGYMRAAFKAEELKALDGRKFLKIRAERRVTADQEGPDLTLENIKSRPPRASAEIYVDGESSDVRIEFVQVDGRWVLNNECFDKLINKAIGRGATLSHQTEDQVIQGIIEMRTGHSARGIFDAPPK